MNLLFETRNAIEQSGHTPDQIKYIGDMTGHRCTWAEFEVLADREYDDSYGTAHVAMSLMIVFRDGVLTRGEYDGAEWWEYTPKFKTPKKSHPITTLFRQDGADWPP